MWVALYARVSTQRQEKEKTIGSQLDALRHYAREHQLEIVEPYVCIDEGYSGVRLDRPGLDHLRDGAQIGAFDAVLVLCPDRLARKYAYQVLVLEELEKFGVRVIFLEQPFSDDPHATLLVQIQGAIAEYERMKIAERYRRGKLYRARQGEVICWKVPYGYRRTPRRDGIPAHVEVYEPEAEVVRQIFRWHVDEGLTIRQITKRLTAGGYPTPTNKRSYWNTSTVSRILHQEAYIGTFYYNRHHRVRGELQPRSASKRAGYRYAERPRQEWIAISVPPIVDLQRCHIPLCSFSSSNTYLLRQISPASSTAQTPNHSLQKLHSSQSVVS